MDARNDFVLVVDSDGTEHHRNLATVVEVAFDREGMATICTAPGAPTTHGARYSVVGEAAVGLRAALARREAWATAPVPGNLPEFRQSPTRPRPL